MNPAFLSRALPARALADWGRAGRARNTLCLSESTAVLQFTNFPIYQFSMHQDQDQHTAARHGGRREEALDKTFKRREGGDTVTDPEPVW